MKLPPIRTNMTTVIAERDLWLETAARRRRIRVRIGRPVRDVATVGGRDWRCPVQVSGLGKVRNDRGLGVDSLQALVDALKAVETQITAIEGRASSQLLWFDLPWHGLPQIRLNLPPAGKQFQKRLRQAIGAGSKAKREPRAARA